MNKLLIVPLICSALYGCNNSSQTNSEANNETNAVSTHDLIPTRANGLNQDSSELLAEVLQGGAMEVELGKLAQKQAQSPRVKAFGAMLVKDHTAANEELKQIVSDKKLAISEEMEKDHMKDLEGLRKKTGVDFDKKYIKMMLSDHRKDIENFEDMAKDSKDPELKAFAAKTLPKLKLHLDSAKSINKEVKASLDKNDISDAMERYPNH
jgi:putative membrane protein